MPNPMIEDGQTDTPYAWTRLAITVLLGTIGAVGMWSVVVVLPTVQAEFGVARGGASLPYTLTMAGFALGGIFAGRLADRFGIVVPLIIGTLALGTGYIVAGSAASITQYALAQGILIGIGSSVMFGPLMADISHWFVRRRGIAVALCASGNYLGGTIWPPTVQYFMTHWGWRHTHVMIGLVCMAAMLPLAFLLRRRAPMHHGDGNSIVPNQAGSLGVSPNTLQILLVVAGLCCCVAMSMPQVHIVAYCGDLGYGVAHGAEMLSLMLACGLVSRIVSGIIADRIGGLLTLLLGSTLQGLALILYMLFDGLFSLYVISALFGLFQGGIVPSYAIIVREYFPPKQAGARVGLVLTSPLLGMALGGWMSGAIFDLTGSYQAAFANGVLWNVFNLTIVLLLVWRRRGGDTPMQLATSAA